MAREKASAPKREQTPAKKPGRLKQVTTVYKETQKADPSTTPWMVGVLVGSIILFTLLLWAIFHSPLYGAFVGLMVGVLGAMIVLARKAQRAMYSRIEGEQGAALAVLQQIPRGWNVESEPAAFDARSRTMLFRASGRSGIALVSESSSGQARRLMDTEVRRMKKMFPNVPVHAIFVGRGENEIPLPRLNSHLVRMKNHLTKTEAGMVSRRLNAMPSPLRQAIPKGIDPMRARPNRRALRGR